MALAKLQFPVIFGGLLAMAGVGFSFRHLLFPNLEEARDKLYNEDPENKRIWTEQLDAIKSRK